MGMPNHDSITPAEVHAAILHNELFLEYMPTIALQEHPRERDTRGERARDKSAGARTGDEVKAAADIGHARLCPLEATCKGLQIGRLVDATHASAVQAKHSVWFRHFLSPVPRPSSHFAVLGGNFKVQHEASSYPSSSRRAAGLSVAPPDWKYPITLDTARCSVIAMIAGSATPWRLASVTKPERRLCPPEVPLQPSQPRPPLYEFADGRRGEGRADAVLPQPPKDRPFGDPCRT